MKVHVRNSTYISIKRDKMASSSIWYTSIHAPPPKNEHNVATNYIQCTPSPCISYANVPN